MFCPHIFYSFFLTPLPDLCVHVCRERENLSCFLRQSSVLSLFPRAANTGDKILKTLHGLAAKAELVPAFIQ